MALMLTCKSTFATAASHVWANLDGVKDLTDLLVEASNSDYNRSPQLEVALDFTRFDIYAPLVRHLRVYGRTSRYVQGEHQRRCTLRSQQSALVPRLESSFFFRIKNIYCRVGATPYGTALQQDKQREKREQQSSAKRESNKKEEKRGLTELRIVPIEKRDATAFISYKATSSIVKTISERCPHIKRIELYPINITGSSYDNLPAVLWKDSLQQSFESLVYLREVTSSIAFVNRGGLATLGFLPGLQSLSIDGCKEHLQEFELSVSDTSFPVLTHLSLFEVDKDTMFALLTVQPLIRRLSSLSFRQCFESLSETYEMGRYSHLWLANTLPLILGHITALKRLGYSIRQGYQYNSYDIDGIPLLQALSELRLEYLSISDVFFQEDFPKSIADACPSLIELRMPDQAVLMEELHWFAHMPNLKRLVISFPVYIVSYCQYTAHGPLKIIENTLKFISCTEFADTQASARYEFFPVPHQTLD
ncbi:hypothetical protein BDV93DRAFT_565164 [Ceratobasidium sp. AG-I]|nr:hypothetical protein BDV93DRAFT_565164 [Ceratobasidium sp. AG-I]